MNDYIQVSVRHIMEQIALNLVYSKYWGADAPAMPQEIIAEQRKLFAAQLSGVLSVIYGTSLFPIGTKCIKYMGQFIPEQFVKALKENKDLWPNWYPKRYTDAGVEVSED